MRLFCRVENGDGQVLGVIEVEGPDDHDIWTAQVFSPYGEPEGSFFYDANRAHRVSWLPVLRAALKAVR